MSITIQHMCAFVALFAALSAIYLLLKEMYETEKPWVWKRTKKKSLGLEAKDIEEIFRQARDSRMARYSRGNGRRYTPTASSMLAKYGFKSGTDFHHKMEELVPQTKMNEKDEALEGCKSIW